MKNKTHASFSTHLIWILVAGFAGMLPDALIAQSQGVAINATGAPAAPSAMLDVVSTTRGMLVPRMNSFQRDAIVSPALGLLVFDTGTTSFWFYNGTNWVNIANPSVLVDADGDTKVEVEQNPDEDMIRFTVAGTERMQLSKNADGQTLLSLPGNFGTIAIGEEAGEANKPVSETYGGGGGTRF